MKLSSTRLAMNKKELIFNEIINHFLKTNQLGDFDGLKSSLTLYDIPNNPKEINEIKKYMDSISIGYKIVILSKNEETTNIKLLDIGI